MKDNEKQIEQMARIIDDRLKEANLYIGSMNNGKGYWIAQRLVEHYQPKIPEGFVVLTNDEWARLRNLEINYNDAYEAYRKYEIQNKGLREENGQLRLENNDLEAQVEKARKETAEEILKWLVETGVINTAPDTTKMYFKEEFGVELKGEE